MKTRPFCPPSPRKFIPLAAVFLAALSIPGKANWTPTAGGTWQYDDPGNWSNGTPNGVFSAAITGPQTVFFKATAR